MPTRSARERRILRGLTAHTRAHVLQLLDEVPGLTLTSGYRSVRYNRQVGGVAGSFHTRRRAVDAVGTRHDLVRAAGLAWALRTGRGCTGPEEVLLEGLGTSNQHLHLAW